jgi:Domain of Unknown Function (DUF1206)
MTSRKAGETAIQIVARLGYAARGLVFLIVGGFAVLAAWDARGPIVGSRGAMQVLLSQPFGGALLWVIAAGLICFACWRVIQAIFDPDGCGNDTRGLLQRLGFIGSAVFHLALAAISITIILGSRRVGDEDSVARDWTAWLLGQPFGMWMVMLIGAGITAAGVVFAWKAVKGDFREHLAADVGSREWIVALGQFGYVARGVVFVIVGVFLMLAAWRFNSGEAAGLVGALRVLQQQAYGSFLLGLIALGLLSYGAFEIIQVFVRRVDAKKVQRKVENIASACP